MGFQPLRRAPGADLIEFRSDAAADTVEFVTPAATAAFEDLRAARQLRRRGIVGGLVTLAAGGLDVFQRQHRRIPMRHAAMGVGDRGGAALAPMTDRAAEFLEWVAIVLRMIGQRLRIAAIAG